MTGLLRGATRLDAVRADLASVVREVLGPARVSLRISQCGWDWLNRDSRWRERSPADRGFDAQPARRPDDFTVGVWHGVNDGTNSRVSETCIMRTVPLLRKIDAVTIPVPDLDAGLGFYRDRLGHELRWRNDATGQAGLGLPGRDSEIVLAARQKYEPDWLVSSVDEAAGVFAAAGGRMVAGPEEIAVGKLVIAEDPFGNVLLDLSNGHYVTDDKGRVTGVAPQQAPGTGPGC